MITAIIAANIEAAEGACIENARVWIDHENRLWALWSTMPEAVTKYCVCENADADSLVFGEVTDTPLGTIISRPIVCADGTYLFGSGVTQREIKLRKSGDRKRGVYIGKLTESGMEICNKRYGNDSVLDTICLAEINGKIDSFIRAMHGIERNTSSDGAATFSGIKNCGYGDYDSKFTASALPTGNFIMLNNTNLVADDHKMLTAFLSLDGGQSLEGVTPIYDGDDLVARGVLMEGYSVEDEGEGVSFCIYAYNVQPGVEINYKNGTNRASDDDTPFPEDEETEEIPEGSPTYVLNIGSGKYHLPTCSGVATMKEENRRDYYGTKEELTTEYPSYDPCGTCKP